MNARNEYRFAGGIVWIKLTQGQETCIDLIDWLEVQKHRWFSQKRKSGGYYAYTKIMVSGKQMSLPLHRLLKGTRGIDHKDRDGLNNRRDNLRVCSNSQNLANRRRFKNNSSGFKGVYWNKHFAKWHAQIAVGGKRRHLGLFKNLIQAARAYNAAAKELFGTFALLNPV